MSVTTLAVRRGRMNRHRGDPYLKGIPGMAQSLIGGLIGSLEGLYSRRISLQHRFVYTVDAAPVAVDGGQFQGTVKVVRMWTHYEGIR